jgi:hypothetical protein
VCNTFISLLYHIYIIVVSFVYNDCITLGHFCVTFVSLLDHFRIIVVSLLIQFCITFDSLVCHFGVTVGSLPPMTPPLPLP